MTDGGLCTCALVFVISVVIIIVTYLIYSGLRSEVVVITGSPPVKKITIVYKFVPGPHKDRAVVFSESSRIGPKLPRIGIFYDDPEKVPGPDCCCAVGSVVSEGEDMAPEDVLLKYKTSGFSVYSFPEVTHVVIASFPHRTSLSVFIGVKRVYPQLIKYIKERRLCAHPFIEVHRAGQILFIAPLARQGDFYVPEVRPLPTQEDSLSDSDVSGAESNSECSRGRGVALPESRESSLHRLRGSCDRSSRSSRTSRSRSKETFLDQHVQQKDEDRGENHEEELWAVVGEEE